MQITKALSVGANLLNPSDILLGIYSMEGECSGCGEPVHMLRIGIGLAEIYFAYHSH